MSTAKSKRVGINAIVGGFGIALLLLGMFLVGYAAVSRAFAADPTTADAIQAVTADCLGPKFKWKGQEWTVDPNGAHMTNHAYPDDYNQKAGHEKAPTRCLDHNRNHVKYDDPATGYIKDPSKLAEGELPIDDRKGLYPVIGKYPPGYPTDRDFKAGDIVPFPGWPKDKPKDNHWTTADRNEYRSKYTETGNGKPPGFARGKKILHEGWYTYQIHHILEQQFGGRNDQKNLVPLKTVKGADNQHAPYTNFWERITPG